MLVPPDNIRRVYDRVLPASQALALEVLFGLRAGVQEIDNLLSAWLADEGLTPGRFQVLVVLWAATGPVAQREIVAALRVTRATVSGLVETLRRDGYLETAVNADDARQVFVSLTASGSAKIDRIARENSDRLRGALTGLSDADLRTLVTMLQQASASLKSA